MPRLVDISDASRAIELSRSRTTVGRADSNVLQLLQRSVSGKHAVIELLPGGGAVLHDTGGDGAGSRFGSFVNDSHFQGGWRELRHGDALRFGTVQHGAAFRFHDDSRESRDHSIIHCQVQGLGAPLSMVCSTMGSWLAMAPMVRAPLLRVAMNERILSSLSWRM